MQAKPYRITYKKSVEKDLRKLPADHLRAIVQKITLLAAGPRPVGTVKLRGSSNLFRMRHGDYRVVYQIADEELIVLVIKVGHRREVYR